MISSYLHVPAVALAADRLQPVGEALVQCHPPALEHALVRRVPDQDVVEPEPQVLVGRPGERSGSMSCLPVSVP